MVVVRMWMVDPALMCRQHLLGEHRELHALVGMANKKLPLGGYGEKGLVEPAKIPGRHAELVAEMERRGYEHRSPLPAAELPDVGNVDATGNLEELRRRCAACRALTPAEAKEETWR